MSDSDRTVAAASVPQQQRAGSSTHPRRTRIGRCVANCFCRTMKEMTLRSGLAGLRHIEMASWVLETPMMLLEYCSGSLGLGRAMAAAAAWPCSRTQGTDRVWLVVRTARGGCEVGARGRGAGRRGQGRVGRKLENRTSSHGVRRKTDRKRERRKGTRSTRDGFAKRKA